MLRIRCAVPEDAPQIARIFSFFAAQTAVSFATEVPDAQAWLGKLEQLQRFWPFLVLEDQGAVRAYAYASPHRALGAYRWCAEISVYVEQGFSGKGYGSLLYSRIIPVLREQLLHRVYAGITLPNAASVQLHERFGFRHFATFRRVGFKDGAWRDVGWWELALQPDSDTSPPEPRSFLQLTEDGRISLSGDAEAFS